MKKAIGALLLGGYGFFLFLILYILSAIEGTSIDEYGLSLFYGKKSYLVLTILFLIVSLYGVYLLVCTLKKKEDKPLYKGVFFASIGTIGFFYFLSEAIGNGLDGESYASPLLFSFFFLIPLGLGILDVVEILKSQSSNR